MVTLEEFRQFWVGEQSCGVNVDTSVAGGHLA